MHTPRDETDVYKRQREACLPWDEQQIGCRRQGKSLCGDRVSGCTPMSRKGSQNCCTMHDVEAGTSQQKRGHALQVGGLGHWPRVRVAERIAGVDASAENQYDSRCDESSERFSLPNRERARGDACDCSIHAAYD
eukprot:7391571-Prymnesium_polylepis.4